MFIAEVEILHSKTKRSNQYTVASRSLLQGKTETHLSHINTRKDLHCYLSEFVKTFIKNKLSSYYSFLRIIMLSDE